MIEINLTLAYQIIAFFILYFVLNTLLYNPVLKVIEERNKNIEGTKKEAFDMEAELQKRLLDYENRLSEAKSKAQEERFRIRQEGLDKEKELLGNARESSQIGLLEAKTRLEQEANFVRTRLKEESKAISKDIAEKILNRKVG